MTETINKKLSDLRHVLVISYTGIKDRPHMTFLRSTGQPWWDVVMRMRWHMWEVLVRADPAFATNTVIMPNTGKATNSDNYLYRCPEIVLHTILAEQMGEV